MPVLAVPTAEFSTVGDLVTRTKDLLLGAGREEMNQLAATATATATTLTVNYALAGITRGSYVAVDTEVMYVWNADIASNGSGTLTVQRAMKGTTAAVHTDGAIVYVNPFFTRYQIRQTLKDEIRSWGPQVFAVKTLDIAGTDFVRGYDMGSIGPWFFILDLRLSPDPLTATPSDKNWPEVPYRVMHSGPTQTFASGNVLTVTTAFGIFDTPRTLHLTYAAPFTVDAEFTDAVTLLTTVGLDTSDLDIPPYGAAWRLASSREVRRMLTEAQGQAADLQAFPPMYALQAAQGFKTFRDSRLNDAVARLRAQYPIRRTQ